MNNKISNGVTTSVALVTVIISDSIPVSDTVNLMASD